MLPRLSLPTLLRQTHSRTLTASCSRFVSSSSSSSSSSSTASDTTAKLTPSQSTDAPTPAELASGEARAVRYPYFVPRVGKTGDSLPVYTDTRNGGTRCLTEIRKVQGDIDALRQDLLAMLTLSSLENGNGAMPFTTSKKPERPRAGRKSGTHSGHPTAAMPVQLSKVANSGKLVVKGNKVREIKAFLEAKGF